MFLALLALVLLGGAAHAVRSGDRSPRSLGRIFLLWLLVGYCGIPMVGVSAGVLLAPERAADILGFPPGNPFQVFLGFAYLGMSVGAALTLRYRGRAMIAPAVGWAIFFAGATYVHLHDPGAHGTLTHAGMLHIFLTHGLIAVLLAGALIASGLLGESE